MNYSTLPLYKYFRVFVRIGTELTALRSCYAVGLGSYESVRKSASALTFHDLLLIECYVPHFGTQRRLSSAVQSVAFLRESKSIFCSTISRNERGPLFVFSSNC